MSKSENLPEITTILPTYCRPECLRKAIQSVLAQTYPHFQLCIYDNASEDATSQVVEEFASQDSRIKYHRHPENIGTVANFQFGLEKVNTPFFSFLSDDDYLLPNFYEEALNGFKKYTEAAFLIGAVIDVDDRGHVVDVILKRWPKKDYFPSPEGLLEMIGKYSNWAGILFRTEFLKKIGPIDPAFKAIDVDYVFRAAAHFPFAISKKPCAVFVQHLSSYSGLNGFKLIHPGWPLMKEKLEKANFLPKDAKTEAIRRLDIDYRNLLRMNFFRCLERKNFKEAAEIIMIYQNHFGRSFLLDGVRKLCKAFTLFQRSLVLLLKSRRFLRRVLKDC